MARRVSFLIVGVQKAGTSALFEYLRQVPELQLPAGKEAHFFDDDLGVDWAAPDYAAYHALFENDDRLWGEATPIYIYWPNCLERIRNYNPAMKLILLIRDPVDRAISHWRMEYAKGKETNPFAWCIRQGRDRVHAGDPTALGFHRVFSYVERGFYGKQVAHLLSLFPRNQLLLLSSQTLATDPNDTIATVCEFLNVAVPFEPLAPRRVRVAPDADYGAPPDDADRALLESLYAADQAAFLGLVQAGIRVR